MEDSSILVAQEGLPLNRNNRLKELLVQSQVPSGSKKPAVTKNPLKIQKSIFHLDFN